MDSVTERVTLCLALTESVFDALDATLETKENQTAARSQSNQLMQCLNQLEDKLIQLNIHHVSRVPPLGDGMPCWVFCLILVEVEGEEGALAITNSKQIADNAQLCKRRLEKLIV